MHKTETLIEENGFKIIFLLYIPNGSEPEPYIMHSCVPSDGRTLTTKWYTPDSVNSHIMPFDHCPYCKKRYPESILAKALLLNARFPVRVRAVPGDYL